MRPSCQSHARRVVLPLALLLGLLAPPARAKEIVRSDGGAVFEASGFVKSVISALVLQRDARRAAEAHQLLLEEARNEAPPGLPFPPAAALPEGGALSSLFLRLGSRLRLEDRSELEVAWQAALSLASDPAFTGGSTFNGTVGGTAPGARRRLFELAGELAAGPTVRVDHDLDRLALKLPLPFGDLTIGRQVLSWGTGRLWNPTDVLSPFPPTAVDREVRRGFDAVRLAVALGDLTQLDLLYLPQRAAGNMGGVARLQTNLRGWDGSLSFGKYVRDLLIGADLAGDLGPIGVHAEGAYTIALSASEPPAPPILSPTTLLPSAPLPDRFFRGVVGAEARPHEKVLLLAEYAFNGYGTSDPAGYAAVLTSPRVLRGEIFGAGRHQAALAASYLASDLFTAQLSVLANLTDPSALLIPTIEYSFTQTVLVRAGAYLPLGRGPDPHAYDGLTAADLVAGSEPYRRAAATRGLRSEYGSTSFGAFIQLGLYVP